VGEGEQAAVNPLDLIEYLVHRYLRPRLGKTLLALLVFGFAWFVWPTPYRAIGPGGMMQVNRFTGVRCGIGESCWKEQRQSAEPTSSQPSRWEPSSSPSCKDWVDTGRNTVRDLLCRGGSSK
jgi:hypothetical protein